MQGSRTQFSINDNHICHFALTGRQHTCCGENPGPAHALRIGRIQQAGRQRTAAATSKPAGDTPHDEPSGGAAADAAADPIWEAEYADLLAQMLDVTPAEAAGWLSKAACKRTLAAGKQLQNGTAHTTAISAAEARQLLDVLSGIIGMQPADMVAMLRKWPRYLACELARPRGVGFFLREELGLTASQAVVFVGTWPQLLGMDVAVLRQRRDAWQRSLSLSDAQLAKVTQGQPRLMSYTVTGIEEKAAALLAWCRAAGQQMMSSRWRQETRGCWPATARPCKQISIASATFAVSARSRPLPSAVAGRVC